MQKVIIDVREEDEFAAEHVAGAINVPLSKLEKNPNIFIHLSDRPISIMCRSGKRATLARDTIHKLNFLPSSSNLEIYKDGIMGWKNEGKPVTTQQLKHLPILRQVHISAGGLALIMAVLAYFVHPAYAFGAAFIGAGLFVAGATGFCGMAMILAKMPWNKQRNNLKQEVCTASTGSQTCQN